MKFPTWAGDEHTAAIRAGSKHFAIEAGEGRWVGLVALLRRAPTLAVRTFVA
jgi:hypothetical protein